MTSVEMAFEIPPQLFYSQFFGRFDNPVSYCCCKPFLMWRVAMLKRFKCFKTGLVRHRFKANKSYQTSNIKSLPREPNARRIASWQTHCYRYTHVCGNADRWTPGWFRHVGKLARWEITELYCHSIHVQLHKYKSPAGETYWKKVKTQLD